MSTFHSLHHGPAILVLPNAWDAGSARLIESLGAKAIATTSAGLAWSRGYPDGNALPNDRLIAATREIARVIRVPLSVDIEAGYSDDERIVARLVTDILNAGAVGINIEDGAGTPDGLCGKIAAIRDATSRSAGGLFVNARTDVYLRRIAAAIHPMPLNIMAVPGLPSFAALQNAGVRRLSAGSAIAQASWGRTGRLASAFLEGDVSELFAAAAEYGKMNELFARDNTA
jgi:2-methylisocitrate lyase-like PEP mutase family enzyme